MGQELVERNKHHREEGEGQELAEIVFELTHQLFADAEIGILADLELKQLEDLIGLEDPELYPAFVGDTQLDEQYRTPLFERIKQFRNLDKPV